VLFADDILLFTKTSSSDCSFLQNLLQQSFHHRGQIVSLNKSKVMFSYNTRQTTHSFIQGLLNIPLTTEFGRYHGVPLFTKRRTQSAYQFILDRISNRTQGWQSKFLNMAGRFTLIKSVTSSLPSHLMQTSLIPASML
jgi:hypothetical protein